MTHQVIEPGRCLAFAAKKELRAALRRVGRTEDVQFSPDGRRLALAGLKTNRLLIVDVEISFAEKVPSIALTGFVEVESDAFNAPHGVAWADDGILVVANRNGYVAIVALPEPGARAKTEPVRVIGVNPTDLVRTPGSLSIRPVGMGLIELLVCNNYVNSVSRHLIDRRDDFRVILSEILIEEGMSVPDGVGHTPCGDWIAVSNHDHRLVFLFRNDDLLCRTSEPQGVLSFDSYPHGLKFSGDGRTLLVADAGAPFVHIFTSEDGDWSGPRTPSGAIRVLGNAEFRRGHVDAREGGPKGIDLTADNRVLVVTCESRPLAFFDMRGLLDAVDPSDRGNDGDETEKARAMLLRYLSSTEERAQREAEAILRVGEFYRTGLEQCKLELRALRASRSWRLSAPFRSLAAGLNGIRGRR